MAIRTPFIVTILFSVLLSISSSVLCYSFNQDIKKWCSQTPNPETCEYFLSHKPNQKPIKNKPDFLNIEIELALERALLGKRNTQSQASKFRTKIEKATWADCLELYDHTIDRLNKTLAGKCSKTDSQTWLSAALTNLEACKSGFYEVGLYDRLFMPLTSNNITKLISNALAINKVPYQEQSTFSHDKDGLPRWVRPGDRKLLQAESLAARANAVVAADGSGNYRTVNTAVREASGNGRYVIYVKAGTYVEQVMIKRSNVMLVGDGIGKTIITGSKSVGGGSTTFNSATVGVLGDGFIAKDITFQNSAGAANHQAVAFVSASDHSVLYRCSFLGYQDTLYVFSQRQFYEECDIYGTIDFIFGNAAAVLQNCNIYARNPPERVNTITAQGRTDPNQNTGIIIHNSRVTAAGALGAEVRTYLGRPWKAYSRTVFMKTYLGSLINPAGWMAWSGNFALNTLYYAEYANTGPGSSTSNRVKWKGYHVITSPSVASQFTVATFIGGNSWLPSIGVPYTPGL